MVLSSVSPHMLWPVGASLTCAHCASLGYTTTGVIQDGDGNAQGALTQTFDVNGVPNGIAWQIICPACAQMITGTTTLATLQAATAKTHPNLLLPVIRATLAGNTFNG